ncbi:MAG TPA: nucleotide disphospho-sugar-binding domain-containing protein [Flavisolibacter sp.]|nr:nucleotide disphospho-sugar-binding domain-containing protein [Flavisolibacter sp.]
MHNSYKQISGHTSIRPGTKILFANFPGDGHFNPLTGLAVHLKNLGCDVRWYTSPVYKEKISKLGIPFYGFKKALDIAACDDINELFRERKLHKSQISKLKFDLIHAFILRSPEYYEDLKDIYNEFSFELMVADITFGGIPFVREKMNIPVIAAGIVPLPENSRDLAPVGLGITPSYTTAGKLRQAMLRFVANKILFAKPTKVMTKMLKSYGIKPEGANIFDTLVKKSTVVLQSGTPSFEYKRSDMSAHVHFAGPLLPYSAEKKEPKWFDEKLKLYSKVVLVTQGTVEKDEEKLLIPSLEAFKDSDTLLIVTTGGARTKELRARYPQRNIIIEDFIAFNDVMPHTDVYISNGGYGGVLLAIQNGLPMVVAGVNEGKNEINARIGYFELGINLGTEKPSASQIRQGVEEVFSNKQYQKNVAKLREEFKQYDPADLCAKQVARLTGKATDKKSTAVNLEALVY